MIIKKASVYTEAFFMINYYFCCRVCCRGSG